VSWGEGGGLFGSEVFRLISSLALLTLTPAFALALINVCFNNKGDLSYFAAFADFGVAKDTIWGWICDCFDPYAWQMIGSFMVFEIVLMCFYPGKRFEGNPTATGHIPVYNANGVECYLITIITLFALNHYDIFDPADVYDKMPQILSSMNLFALAFCAFLMFKGLYFPSTKDSGSNGSVIVDYFWGTELYPRLLAGWVDVKQWTNCRTGMMFWQVGIICYAFAQLKKEGFVSSSMLVSVLVQSVYIFKFFLWETGYFKSMDIQHDRAGYYICWGCLVWVPSVYTIHTYYMVEHAKDGMLSVPTALFWLVGGLVSIYINYDCDKQRQDFRQFNGKQKIWGKAPTFIEAKYTPSDGKERTSLLLTSGYFGMSQKFQYIPEIMAAVFWCCPTIPAMVYSGEFTFFQCALPAFYPIYLTILLFDRAWRDDARCAAKYTVYWEEYCQRVPYKVIPGVI